MKLFSEKSNKEKELFVETDLVEEVSNKKTEKKSEVFLPKEVTEDTDIFPVT